MATLVENSLLHFDGDRYRLLAWCIMPNHVHVLIETITINGLPGSAGIPAGKTSQHSPHSLSKIIHSWKSFTATEANRILGRTGPFWFREYHDRYIRDEKHLANVLS